MIQEYDKKIIIENQQEYFEWCVSGYQKHFEIIDTISKKLQNTETHYTDIELLNMYTEAGICGSEILARFLLVDGQKTNTEGYLFTQKLLNTEGKFVKGTAENEASYEVSTLRTLRDLLNGYVKKAESSRCTSQFILEFRKSKINNMDKTL